ncbi:unnamed protein product, partial [Candidula unifasciata]
MHVTDIDRDSGRWSPQLSALPDTVVKTFNDAREVDDILRILQVSAEHDELEAAFRRLEQLFVVIPRYLEDSHVYTSILSTMAQMSTDLTLQEVGLDILHTFMLKSPVMEDKMKRKANLFIYLSRLLSENPKAYKIQAGALRLLARIIDYDHIRTQISHLRQWQHVLESVMNAIRHFHHDSQLLYSAVMILTYILRDNPDLQMQLAEKYTPLIMLLFKPHIQQTELVRHLLHVLWQTAHCEQARQYLALPVVTLMSEQITFWHSDVAIICECFSLLEKLCLYEKFAELLVDKDLLMRSVLPEMMSSSEDARIQLYGLRIFVLTADHLFRHVTFDDAATQWLKVIYLAMFKHMGRAEIQVILVASLVWSSPCFVDPIHTLCLGAILMHEKDEEVFTSACKAIYYLTADNEGLCKTLMFKNPHIAIIQGLRYHSSRPKAISAACRAIRGLCIFQYDHKNQIAHYDEDLLSLLLDIIRNFPNDPEVQSEIISTVACLADIDLFRHQCFVVNMHLRILEAMECFPGDEFLQEVAVEALAVLGGAASGSDILNSSGTIDKIIKCMKRFLSNGNLQKKGLCAIQILAEWQLVQSTVMCHELVSIIKSTMKNYPKSLIIQREAIVAIQILAEKGVDGDKRDQYSNMAEVLVDEDCHELLFQILEKHDEDQGLHDLASECLYVLGIEQDLKSRMLRAACSKGYIAGAECLIEVGADVNMGQGTETPLYQAVSNNNESMVAFLLQHGVRDVLTSLKLSLAENYHSITGMLLACIGQDKETGTVLWANLGLGNIRPEWILPTLYGQNRPHSSSITSKHFVAKIKHSELKRNHRLIYSPSDSRLEIFRPTGFRFPNGSVEDQSRNFRAIQEHHTATEGLSRRPNTMPRMRGRRLLGEGEVVVDDSSQLQPPSPAVLINDAPVFEPSEDEWEDWKQTTLTGANIPFSPSDPRRPSDPAKSQQIVPKLKGEHRCS